MKKNRLLYFVVFLILSLTVFINIKSTTSKGINYQVSEIEIPLYLKVLNFYDRHFNYQWLVRRVTGHLKTKEEKVFSLFRWTHETIRHQPEYLPVIDDHVWSVYVRGYGVSDNFNDLFSTLCNYVGVDGFFTSIIGENSDAPWTFSFVRLERGWVVFDPYHGVYFTNKRGKLATVEEIKKQNWKMVILEQTEPPPFFYEPYLKLLPDIGEIGLGRSSIQSPVNRLKYFLVRWFSDKNLS
jgi:hypothetical protein